MREEAKWGEVLAGVGVGGGVCDVGIRRRGGGDGGGDDMARSRICGGVYCDRTGVRQLSDRVFWAAVTDVGRWGKNQPKKNTSQKRGERCLCACTESWRLAKQSKEEISIRAKKKKQKKQNAGERLRTFKMRISSSCSAPSRKLSKTKA